ncbi:MAG: hypothetical protein V1798_00635 [Pseudomonadota bacterium]
MGSRRVLLPRLLILSLTFALVAPAVQAAAKKGTGRRAPAKRSAVTAVPAPFVKEFAKDLTKAHARRYANYTINQVGPRATSVKPGKTWTYTVTLDGYGPTIFWPTCNTSKFQQGTGSAQILDALLWDHLATPLKNSPIKPIQFTIQPQAGGKMDGRAALTSPVATAPTDTDVQNAQAGGATQFGLIHLINPKTGEAEVRVAKEIPEPLQGTPQSKNFVELYVHFRSLPMATDLPAPGILEADAQYQTADIASAGLLFLLNIGADSKGKNACILRVPFPKPHATFEAIGSLADAK